MSTTPFTITGELGAKHGKSFSRPDIDSKPNQPVSKERFAFIDQCTAAPLGESRHTQIGLFGREG